MNQSLNSQPLVSVIIVTKNSSKTLAYTLKTLQGQDYPNFEVIIVDSLSSDTTIAVADSFSNLIPITCISERDDGIYDAMNKGIKLAKGQIICFLNSDDYYPPSNLSYAVSHFNSHPNVDVVYGNIAYVAANHQILRNLKPKIQNLSWRMSIYQPSCFLRRKSIVNYRFEQKYNISGDYDYFSALYSSGLEFSYCQKIITFMQVGGISSKSSSWIFQNFIIQVKYYGLVKAILAFCMNVSYFSLSRLKSFLLYEA
jgi:glycosyltransferase involved in cell wall biosynthesis